jgi:hypothetical protein
MNDGKIVLEPLPMTLAATHGSVAPLNRPEDFRALRRIARAECEDRWLAKQIAPK